MKFKGVRTQDFNPRTSCEVRQQCLTRIKSQCHFNPRTSCEVRLSVASGVSYKLEISIHAPRVRCDPFSALIAASTKNFNPRTSCEVRPADEIDVAPGTYISIHAPRVRCDICWVMVASVPQISIHAPRVRCDNEIGLTDEQVSNFNPRTSCEVRPYGPGHRFVNIKYFNPRTSCEVRLTVPPPTVTLDGISIHAPRVRCDNRPD